MAKLYYEKDGVAIWHGDCREVLPNIKADVLVTDPPYGIAYASNREDSMWRNAEIANDQDVSLRDEMLASFTEWLAFGSWRAPAPPGYRHHPLIWDKGDAGMGDLSFPWKQSFELIFIAGNGWKGSRDPGVIKGFPSVTYTSQGRLHPNEKPVELMRYLISKRAEEEVIFEPFMGSGSTLVAAQSAGRRAIGCDVEEIWCEQAAIRLEHPNMPTRKIATRTRHFEAHGDFMGAFGGQE